MCQINSGKSRYLGFTYQKKYEVEASVDYGLEFLDPKLFKWYTRSHRTLQPQEVQRVIQSVENSMDIYIFVKKDDDIGTDFYYLGRGFPDKSSVEEDRMTDMNGKELPLEQAVEGKLNYYLMKE